MYRIKNKDPSLKEEYTGYMYDYKSKRNNSKKRIDMDIRCPSDLVLLYYI